MRAFARYAAPFAALVGLTVALAPAAGASTARPAFGVTRTHDSPAATTVTGCHDETVSTTGLATESITTDGPHTVVRFTDAELGDGFTFTAAGTATFWGHHPWYRFDVEGTWFNDLFPLGSFHGRICVKVFATPWNAPVGFESTVEGVDCGP
jgi:hypothetical protein